MPITAITISFPLYRFSLLPHQLTHKHPFNSIYFHQIDSVWQGGGIQARSGAGHGGLHDFGAGKGADGYGDLVAGLAPGFVCAGE